VVYRGWRGGMGSWWDRVGSLSLVMRAHSVVISSTGIGRKWKRIHRAERDNFV